jgi:cellulose synthase/poly-beta-1,6-N-acetylglucosamine synthase-like glycosyltransferase
MAPHPRVTVVLPAYNAEPFVGEAIDSILGQTLTDLELIAIDDGSTDSTGRILAHRAARDPRVRLIARENRGLTRTLNEGLAEARAGYVAIMNADDVALPERLEKQAAFLDAQPRVAAVGGQTRLIAEDGRRGPATSLPTSPGAVRAFISKASPLAHPAAMLRRPAVLAAGGYRPQMEPAEDYDLWLRLAEHNDLANLPDVVLEYRVHSGQATAKACEAVAIATLVAQAAANRRAAGARDSVDTAAVADRSLAAALGISESEIARQTINTALSRAESILAAGGPASAARESLRSLEGHPVAVGKPKLLTAARRWLEGRILMSAGRHAAAVPLIIEAAIAEPTFRSRLAGAIERRVNDRLRRARQ